MSKNPASLKDLKAKFKGASAEFLLEHALSESSMDEVTASYIEDLEAKNRTAEKELNKLKAAMEEEEEEVVAEEDEEAVAMDEEEAEANDEVLAASSSSLQKLAAMINKISKPQRPKARPQASAKRRTTGKGRVRTGAKAVKKSVANASRTAMLSAVQQVQKLAQARISETGEAKHVATRAVLKENPKLHGRMLAEAKA